MKKNVIVGQSGGPTAVINASLYGVVYEALNREDVCGTVYGMINGIEGFLNGFGFDTIPEDFGIVPVIVSADIFAGFLTVFILSGNIE